MKALDIYIDDKMQRGFIRRAVRRFKQNKEYVEAMFLQRGVGEFHVERLVKLKITESDETEVNFNEAHYQALKDEAHRLGLEFGTIHTHINMENASAPSKHDHLDGVVEGEALMGVLEVWQEKGRVHTKLDFWQPQAPCKINLIRSK